MKFSNILFETNWSISWYTCVEHLSFLNAILYVIFMSCWFESFLHNILSMCYEVRTRYNKFSRLTFRRILSQNVLNNTRSSSHFKEYLVFNSAFYKTFFILTLVVQQKSKSSNVKMKERMVRTLLKHSYSTKEKKVSKNYFSIPWKRPPHILLFWSKEEKLFSFQKLAKKVTEIVKK